MLVGNDVTTIVTIVVVGTCACCNRQEICDFVGQIELSAIDVLLTFHLRVKLVGVGSNAHLAKHTCQNHIEHGNTVVVLDEATATHNANHG